MPASCRDIGRPDHKVCYPITARLSGRVPPRRVVGNTAGRRSDRVHRFNSQTPQAAAFTDANLDNTPPGRPACPHPRAARRPAVRSVPDTSRLPTGWARPPTRPRAGDHWQTIRTTVPRDAAAWVGPAAPGRARAVHGVVTARPASPRSGGKQPAAAGLVSEWVCGFDSQSARRAARADVGIGQPPSTGLVRPLCGEWQGRVRQAGAGGCLAGYRFRSRQVAVA
jgi:hypothetical protein